MSTLIKSPASTRLGPLLVSVLLTLATIWGCESPTGSTAKIQVSGVLTYQDTGSTRGIVDVRVEIWRYAPRPPGGWAWANDFVARTDGSGRFSVEIERSPAGSIYALRVFAWNRAARCCYGTPTISGIDRNDPSYVLGYVEPGWPDGRAIQFKPNETEDVNWTYHFDDTFWSGAFNIIETMRHGLDFIEPLRDPVESAKDPLEYAHIARGGCAHVVVTSCMYPVSGDIFVGSSLGFDDVGLLHEYAHWVQYQVGSLAWIPSDHSGCNPQSISVPTGGGGDPVERLRLARLEHAWMEGFAAWLAFQVNAAVGTAVKFHSDNKSAQVGGMGESTSCSLLDGEKYERHVANMLLDLSDPAGGPAEPLDRSANLQWLVVQAMDGPGSMVDVWPTSLHFFWVASERHFNNSAAPAVDLTDIYDLNRINWVYLN